MSDHLLPSSASRPEPERFKRRQFVAPHRRRKLVYRLARPFLAAVAIVGIPAVVVGWVLLSNQFAIVSLKVISAGRVSPAWAEESLATLHGKHLFGVELDEVEAALSSHPWVEGVLLRKRLPNRLEVEVVERRPAALLRHGTELFFLDRDGEEIAPYDPQVELGDLVLLSAPERRRDLIAVGLELVDRWRRRSLPWEDGLSEVEVLTRTDFRVVLAGLPFPVLVSSLNLVEGLSSLVRYQAQLERRLSHVSKLASVDLRFRGLIVLQPAAFEPQYSEVETDV